MADRAAAADSTEQQQGTPGAIAHGGVAPGAVAKGVNKGTGMAVLQLLAQVMNCIVRLSCAQLESYASNLCIVCIPLKAFSVWTGAGGGFVERRVLLKNQCWLCAMDATKCHVCLLLSPAPSAGATAVLCFVPWLQADVPCVDPAAQSMSTQPCRQTRQLF